MSSTINQKEARAIRKQTKRVPNVVSALTARAQFGQILKRVSENGERFVVRRRGEPRVVILGIQDYIKLVAPEPEVLTRIGEASERKGTNQLTLRQINAEIRAYRRENRAKANAHPQACA
jgi:prevent-host-death family protein